MPDQEGPKTPSQPPPNGSGGGSLFPPGSNPNLIPVNIEDEMRRSYLDYAMSVIVGRALPDVRDGLKPVHRRILYRHARNGSCTTTGRPASAPRSSARCMGKYHPHGDAPIYDALVRMAQPFSHALSAGRRSGQLRFGRWRPARGHAVYRSAPCPASRRTLLEDIDKETVDFRPTTTTAKSNPRCCRLASRTS